MKSFLRKTWRTILLFGVLALRMYFSSHAQMVKPDVIGSCGSSYTNPNNHVVIEWVFGETSVITLGQANPKLTQGFLQPMAIIAAGPLPVTLLYFNAQRHNKDLVQLEWATSTELNNQGFYIERKQVAQSNFSRVKFVPTSAIGGNSSMLINYSSPDSNNNNGISYYRLAQVDLNGATKYSETRLVPGYDDDVVLHQWPNPSTGSFYILVNNSVPSKGNLFDASGRLIRKMDIQPGVQSEVSALAKGVYVLQINLLTGERIGSKKIVVQ